MTPTRTILSSLFLIFSCIIIYNNVFTTWLIEGKYVYDKDSNILKVRKGNILQLDKNGTFNSNFWGKGSYSIKGSSLKLVFLNKDKMKIYAKVYRSWLLGSPRININIDKENFFKRIND